MKLEVGKRYISRCGIVSFPLTITNRSLIYTFLDPLTEHTFDIEGRYYVAFGINENDLITEYVPRVMLPEFL